MRHAERTTLYGKSSQSQSQLARIYSLYITSLFEMSRNGTLKTIAGGVQPTKEDYDVYGSCVYRSRITGKQFLFANAKSAEYLQFELTWVDDALHTTLVRNFTGGSGGQVEGCVSDEANGWVIIGEEPYGLWRYGAEPDDDATSGHLIASIDDSMYADVEGVTLIEGASADKGFILVSQQGVSAYNVYRRAPPHAFIQTFTIYENGKKGIDRVTNTDGITAVGTFLGNAFPKGLIVVRKSSLQRVGPGPLSRGLYKACMVLLPMGLFDWGSISGHIYLVYQFKLLTHYTIQTMIQTNFPLAVLAIRQASS